MIQSKKITAIVLAAGLASRMKKSKLNLAFKKHTIIEEVVFQLSASLINDIILVTGSYKEEIEKLFSKNTQLKFTYNSNYKLGMTSSIQCGLKAVALDSDGYLICLGDMPFIRAEDYSKIILNFNAQYTNSPLIIRPYVNELPANPVLFSKHFKKEILALNSKQGAKPVIQNNLQFLQKIQLNKSTLKDIDTENDYLNFVKV